MAAIMEEPESQVEKVSEDMNEHAHHAGVAWISRVALSSAILAALAAVTASLSGHHANEAMSKQIESSDQWAMYQAKGIKLAVLESRLELMEAMGKPVGADQKEKAEKEAKEKAEKDPAAAGDAGAPEKAAKGEKPEKGEKAEKEEDYWEPLVDLSGAGIAEVHDIGAGGCASWAGDGDFVGVGVAP